MADAVRFLQLTPSGYKGSVPGSDFSSERKGLIDATTTLTTPASASTSIQTLGNRTPTAAAAATSTLTVRGHTYTGYSAPL